MRNMICFVQKKTKKIGTIKNNIYIRSPNHRECYQNEQQHLSFKENGVLHQFRQQ